MRIPKYRWLILIIVLGVLIALFGIVYGVFTSGLPYPDATPEQSEYWNFHNTISSRIFDLGAICILLGVVMAFIKAVVGVVTFFLRAK